MPLAILLNSPPTSDRRLSSRGYDEGQGIVTLAILEFLWQIGAINNYNGSGSPAVSIGSSTGTI